MKSIYLVVLLFVLSACAQKVNFQKSSIVPAAVADMKVEKDKNENYIIEIEVKNLAKPQSLTPSRKVYVVWNQSVHGNFNLGQLRVNDKLKAKLKASTVYKPEKIIIAAENDPMATQPSNQVVLESEKPKFK